jgi:hypothetical protein
MGKIFLMIMENKCYQINTINQNVLNTTPLQSSSLKEISLDSEIEKSYNFFNTSLLLSSELMDHTIRKVQVNLPNLRFVQLEFPHYP